MPTSETWMPVLPRGTLSVGLLGKFKRVAAEAVAVPTAASAVGATVAWARKARRFNGGVITRDSRSWGGGERWGPGRVDSEPGGIVVTWPERLQSEGGPAQRR